MKFCIYKEKLKVILMNIAFVNSTHKWGGVKTWCLDNAVVFASRGHRVFIYGRQGSFISKAQQLGIAAVPFAFGMDFSLKAILFFLREFRRNKIQVCVCNVSKDLRTAGVAAKLLGIPIIQHIGNPLDIANRLKTHLALSFFKPRMVTCSEFCRTNLLSNIPGLEKYHVEAIHPGVVCPGLYPVREKHTPRTVIMTSQLNMGKGHDCLFRALRRLKEAHVAFQCRIVGTGPAEKAIRQLCRDEGLETVTTFTGFSTDIFSELSRGDIFVLPSANEGLGIALEEAMASGLPCIAKDGCGPTEIWPPEYDAFLIPEGDDGEILSDRLGMLLTCSDEELQKIGKVFHANAQRKCDREKQAARLEAWLQGAVAAR